MNSSQLLFPDKWLDPTSIGERIDRLDAPEVVRKISSAKAASIAGKTPECQKLIKKSSSVWSICSDRYLFIFSKEKEEGLQKVSVWSKKLTGVYICLKTVWTKLEDNIFEAVPYFVSSYFDINVSIATMRSDSGVLEDLEDELKYLLHHPTLAVKGKEKLLRHWSEFLPAFISSVTGNAIFPKSPDGGSQPLKSPIEELMSSGRPVSIEEFNEVLWRADYADDIFREADRILYEKEDFENQDSDFLEAAILYDSLMGHEDLKAKRGTAFNRRDRLIKLGNRILAKWNGTDDWSEQEFRDFNIQAPAFDLMTELEEKKICASLGKIFQSLVNDIFHKELSFSPEIAKAIVNCRRICKRIPKEISDKIKKYLEWTICLESTWDPFCDPDIDYDRLRKLVVSCGAVTLMGYHPELAYTKRLMDRERVTVMTSDDPRYIMDFCRLLPDYDWFRIDADYLHRLLDHIKEVQACHHSDTDTLRLACAKLLIFRKLGKSPLLTLDSSPLTLDSYPKEEWGNLAADFILAEMDGKTTIEKFCHQHSLPLSEFRAFASELKDKFSKLTDHLNSLDSKS